MGDHTTWFYSMLKLALGLTGDLDVAQSNDDRDRDRW
jgi:hypothetical protein